MRKKFIQGNENQLSKKVSEKNNTHAHSTRFKCKVKGIMSFFKTLFITVKVKIEKKDRKNKDKTKFDQIKP